MKTQPNYKWTLLKTLAGLHHFVITAAFSHMSDELGSFSQSQFSSSQLEVVSTLNKYLVMSELNYLRWATLLS